ncbi:MAG TPA: helix-turn-helix domain-containing protein [Pseudonocardiaceae bacterium]|jgi:DNA-binding HxlR family transcriptional regulator|nr:helix-turn-helix domain-containing protein [Pseudonocardiaceae bacterium]
MAANGERNYRQYCGLAAALDAVGERWTLLVVRELLLGPRRYTELLADLPGIGTNLLADRLRKLCALGVAVHHEDGYRLGPAGDGLRAVVLDLSKWGIGLLGEPTEDMVTRAHWALLAVQAMADASDRPDLRESYEFQVADEVFHLRVTGGVVRTLRGPADDAVLRIRTDPTTFVRIGAGVVGPFEALASGALEFTGEPDAVLRCAAVLGLTGRRP